MTQQQEFLLSQSILLPALIALVRIKQVPELLPLLLCLLSGISIEIILLCTQKHELINLYLNIYVLLEFLLLSWQLRKWGAISGNLVFIGILLSGISFWLITTFMNSDYGTRNHLFRLFYSLVLVLGAIELINKLSFERIPLSKDYRFLISLGFVVFFMYNILVESLCIPAMNFSNHLISSIFNIKVFLNFATNILYFTALLCIPKKKVFTL